MTIFIILTKILHKKSPSGCLALLGRGILLSFVEGVFLAKSGYSRSYFVGIVRKILKR